MAFTDYFTKIFGSKNERELKRLRPYVDVIGGLDQQMRALPDLELRAKTGELKQKLATYASNKNINLQTCEKKEINEALWGILPEAFAVAREAGRRVLDMRHFDVQLLGGMILHDGKIAEMKTGEGKTLVATLAVYLNALAGRGVHLVTVNDYLAQRDAEWMGRMYTWLGLSVGTIINGINDQQRQRSYQADVTYGQNNEFGFDYLRDNMKFRLQDYVQRELFFGIVDEVDSILIDEARTPLIISGSTEDSTDKYAKVNAIIPSLKREVDYTVDEKARSVMLTEEGVRSVEKRLSVDNLYDPANITDLHHVNQALRAHAMYKRDVDYVIDEGEVKIVDEFTGRLMEGRRWSDGLHQAVEAKEGVEIQNENQTLATITFQNYFRMYKKLSGMTGTADTEATEFANIYNLDVVVAPTHRNNVRRDMQDIIYLTEKEKFDSIMSDIVERHGRGQPVLVGTVSVEKSEVISRVLKKTGTPHAVLNAKYHLQEATIVAQAGRKGAVMISTNMAGRGTDILLGGNAEYLAKSEVGEPPVSAGDPAEHEKALAEFKKRYEAAFEKYKAQCKAEHDDVVAAGGLHIIGTERHESRRIDNQLRGRAGRQGDPGSSRFYLSLDDDLIRVFGGDRMKNLMTRFGMKPGEVIEHPWVTRSIENAQKRVEAHNFDIRKNLLEYDDVMNQQRKAIYALRREVLGGTDAEIREKMLDLIEGGIIATVETTCPQRAPVEKWDIPALAKDLEQLFATPVDFAGVDISHEALENRAYETVEKFFLDREKQTGEEVLRRVERRVYLELIDTHWKDHLLQMDHLKEGIHLRGYGQKDPKQEYKKEGYNMFVEMMARMQSSVIETIFHVTITQETPEEYERRQEAARARQKVVEQHQQIPGGAAAALAAAPRPAPLAPLQQRQGGGGPPRGPQGQQAAPPPPAKIETYRRERPKVGRNEPCYCGSGKKYKNCHLSEDEQADRAAH